MHFLYTVALAALSMIARPIVRQAAQPTACVTVAEQLRVLSADVGSLANQVDASESLTEEHRLVADGLAHEIRATIREAGC